MGRKSGNWRIGEIIINSRVYKIEEREGGKGPYSGNVKCFESEMARIVREILFRGKWRQSCVLFSFHRDGEI